jgi:hypothetical protein
MEFNSDESNYTTSINVPLTWINNIITKIPPQHKSVILIDTAVIENTEFYSVHR